MEKASETKSRLPYHKPRLEEVPLKADEAVLQSCKNPGTEDCQPIGHEPARLPQS